MDPLSLLSLGMTGIGALGSLFAKDPNEEARKRILQAIAKMQTDFGRQEGALKTREAVSRRGLLKSVSDVGATGGMPRSVIEQKLQSAALGSKRNLEEALGGLDARRQAILANVAQMQLQVPQKQSPFPTLLSLGIQGLDLFGSPFGGGEKAVAGSLGDPTTGLPASLGPGALSQDIANLPQTAASAPVPSLNDLLMTRPEGSLNPDALYNMLRQMSTEQMLGQFGAEGLQSILQWLSQQGIGGVAPTTARGVSPVGAIQ